jgi:hypothetical protein
MHTQSVKTPIPSENVTLTLSPEEHNFLILELEAYIGWADSLEYSKILTLSVISNLLSKLKFLKPNSGDACLHPAQSPDAVGQDGTTCRHCGGYGVTEFDLSPCSSCQSPDALGQGGN